MLSDCAMVLLCKCWVLRRGLEVEPSRIACAQGLLFYRACLNR